MFPMLKAKKGFTKKELKQDEFITFVVKTKMFLEENANKILMGVLTVLAIVLLGYFWHQSKENAEITAASLVTQAQYDLQNNQKDRAIATLTQVMDEYEGTNSAAIAALQLAKLYWSENNLASAKTFFQKFIDEYEQENFLLQAGYAGLADCYFAEKNYTEAAKYYEKAAKIDRNFPLSANYLYSAAAAYKEAGNTQKAKTLAKQVIDMSKNNMQLKSRAEILYNSIG
jgi:tetratricopeptide (TPR) repeat protein